MPRFLYISAFFPPLAGIEVKRAMAVTRHVGHHGWEPVVLAARPEPGRATDEDLMRHLPELEVIRDLAPLNHWLRSRQPAAVAPKAVRGPARRSVWSRLLPETFTNGYLLPLDRFWVDIAWSVLQGVRLVRAHQLELIHVNAGPMSSLVVGALISRLTGVPFVADLRDPWTLQIAKANLAPRVSRWADRRFEAFAFRSAAKVILNTETCLAAYRAHYSDLPSSRFTFARNAFDRPLYGDDPNEVIEPSGPFTFFYFGSFRILVEPGPLARGLRRLIDTLDLTPDDVRFGFAGKMRAVDRELFESLELAPFVDDHGFVTLAEGFRLIRAAHAAVLVVAEDYRLQIPGKLYDYFAAGRPLLAISANDEVNRILTETGAGVWADQADDDAVLDGLIQLYEGRVAPPDPDALAAFSAPALGARLAAIFDEVS